MFADPTYDIESPEWRTLVADQEGKYFPWSECIDHRRCSVCFGTLIREWNYDRGIIEMLCNIDCLPKGGHVSEDYVKIAWAQDEEDWRLVSENYPKLAKMEEERWASLWKQ